MRPVPYEIWEEKTWEIYDPMLAQVIATFHKEDEARKYLKKLNKRREREW